ncbi:hypothetical protein ACFOYU_11720 [Microvirga sp. GCM10011540]
MIPQIAYYPDAPIPLPVEPAERAFEYTGFTADPDEVDEDDAEACARALIASFARTAPAVSAPVAETVPVQIEQPAPAATGDYLPVDVVAAETAAEHADDAIRFDRLVPAEVVERILAEAGVELPAPSTRKDRKGRRGEVLTAFGAIFGSALMAADAGRRCSVSFHRPHYTRRAQYEGKSYTHANIADGVRKLATAGLLGLRVAGGGKKRVPGTQSTFWATDRLLELLDGVELQHNPELKAPLRLKDENGNLLPFKHSAVTRALMQDLNALNMWMRSFTVTLPGVEPTERGQWRFPKEIIHDDGTRETVESVVCPTLYPQVYQVFSRGRWDLHGRLYGYWQSIPSDWRPGLMLNGMRTVELDFSAMHPTILYAERGHDIVAEGFDPYKVSGFEDLRAACKLALNIAINAASLEEAVGALMARRKAKDPKKRWRLSRKRTVALLEAAIAHNASIADAICSDAGIRLMRVDSRVMREVLFDCMAAAIPALPVHDSVVVPARYMEQVKAIMQAAYLRIVNVLTPCVIKDSSKKVTQVVAGGLPAPVALPVPAPRTSVPVTLVRRPAVTQVPVAGALEGGSRGPVSLVASLRRPVPAVSSVTSSDLSKGVASAPSSDRQAPVSTVQALGGSVETLEASDVSSPVPSQKPCPLAALGLRVIDHDDRDEAQRLADDAADALFEAALHAPLPPAPVAVRDEAAEARAAEAKRKEAARRRAKRKDAADRVLCRGKYRRVAGRDADIVLPNDPWGIVPRNGTH